MSAIERFEDLIAWQKARELTKRIYHCTSQGSFSKDFGLRDQIRRASVSVMSNIAEGFERSGRPEFHQFLVIAKGSCAEVRSQLYVAKDVAYLTENEFSELMALAAEVSRIIGGLRSSIKKQLKRRPLSTGLHSVLSTRNSVLPLTQHLILLSPQHSLLSTAFDSALP